MNMLLAIVIAFVVGVIGTCIFAYFVVRNNREHICEYIAKCLEKGDKIEDILKTIKGD